MTAQAFERARPASARARHRGQPRGRDRGHEAGARGRAARPGRGRDRHRQRARAGAAITDIVVATGELDQSWCHTVGYLSPLLAAARSGRAAAGEADAAARRRGDPGLLAPGSAPTHGRGARRRRDRLAERAIIVIASGADRPAGRELALKIEEAAWIPTAYRDLETFLHGHLPATGDSTGLVLILTDRRARDERVARARQALAAAGGSASARRRSSSAGVAAELDPALTPAGRIVVPEAPSLPAPVAALLATATPLQLFTERLARVAGRTPTRSAATTRATRPPPRRPGADAGAPGLVGLRLRLGQRLDTDRRASAATDGSPPGSLGHARGSPADPDARGYPPADGRRPDRQQLSTLLRAIARRADQAR